MLLRLLVVTATLAVASADLEVVSENANPIRRVTNLLQKMLHKITEEGEAEEALFNKFNCFCKGNTASIGAEVKAAQEALVQTEAEVQRLTALRSKLKEEILEHKQDRRAAKVSLDTATSQRKKEKEEFQKQSASATLDLRAMQKAIKVLRKGVALTQFMQTTSDDDLTRIRKTALVSNVLSSYEKEMMTNFLQGQSTSAGTGEIIGILSQMEEDAQKALDGAVATEDAAVKSFGELKALNLRAIAEASKAIEDKQVRQGEAAVGIAEAKAELENLKKEVGANVAFLADLANQCKTKEKEWQERSQMRAEEKLAISEVIKMLTSDDALDLFKGTLGTPKPSFMQVETPAATEAANILKRSSRLELRLLANMIGSKKITFDKVVKMIDDMVVLLRKEQTDDDDKKAWCDEEIRDTEGSLKDLGEAIEGLEAGIESDKTEISTLAADIENLKEENKQMKREMADSTEMRTKEREEFEEEEQTLVQAKALLGKAAKKLAAFYNKAESFAQISLLKRGREEPAEEEEAPQKLRDQKTPDTWSGGYRQKNTGGVMMMMNNLEKELQASLIEAQNAEKNAQAEYERLKAEGRSKVKANDASIVEKQGAKANTETRLNKEKIQLSAHNQDQQEKTQYLSEVNAACKFLLQNYDYRKDARRTEIDTLGQAKAVLQGAEVSSFIQMADDPPTEVNYQKIEPFGKEDTAHELTKHAAKTQDTLVDAVENAEVAEIKRTVFRSLTRLRAATIKEFDTIARLETQAIDAYNDAHHYRAENPLAHLHEDEAAVPTDKLKSFH